MRIRPGVLLPVAGVALTAATLGFKFAAAAPDLRQPAAIVSGVMVAVPAGFAARRLRVAAGGALSMKEG